MRSTSRFRTGGIELGNKNLGGLEMILFGMSS